MKKWIYNIVFGVLGQVVILALGILVPRFVLRSYGDEANGLINAIGQLFTYLALIEAGVGQAALQSLYRPTVEKDYNGINAIMSATQQMFRKLTTVYSVIVVGVSVFYPLLITVEDKETISFFGSTYWAIFFIILIQGLSNAITFYFVASLRQALIADGRNYIIVNITTLTRVAISVLRIILINIGINLVLLQIVYVVINLAEAIIYIAVLRKKYPWMNMKSEPDVSALKQKNSFVVHEICNVIFSSTSVLILSIFCDLAVASVYAIYNLVFSALNTLINQLHSGCFYILGQTYSQSKEKYEKTHDAYDTYYIAFVFATISTAYLFITPFIRLYTEGVTDYNYIYDYLPLLFCLVQLLSCCRITSSNLIKLAGHAKKTINRAVAEAVINIVCSVVLVNLIGIYGVLLGPIIALLYRTNDMIMYANKRIMERSPLKTYRTVILNFALFAAVVFVGEKLLTLNITDFVSFFIKAAIAFILLTISFVLINSVVDRKSLRFVVSLIFKKT